MERWLYVCNFWSRGTPREICDVEDGTGDGTPTCVFASVLVQFQLAVACSLLGLLVLDRFSRKLERPRKPLSRRGTLVELQVTLAQHEPGKGQDSVGGRFASAYHWGADERG